MSPSLEVFVLMVACASVVRQNRTALRIYNGVQDVEGRYSYVVALIYSTLGPHNTRMFVGRCTGTAIGSQWILTAAHCLNNNLVYVEFSNINLSSMKSWKSRVLKMIKHPNYERLYNEIWSANDIAMVRIQPVYIKFHGQISAVDYTKTFGINVVYAGFGKSRNNEYLSTYSKPLYKAQGIMIQCPGERITYGHSSYLCVSSRPNIAYRQYALPGDSGGPLLYKDKVIGVASQSHRNSTWAMIVYTPTSQYLKWIHDLILNRNIIDVKYLVKKMLGKRREHLF